MKTPLKSRGSWPSRSRRPWAALAEPCKRGCALAWAHRAEIGAGLLTGLAVAAEVRASINAVARYQGAMNNKRAIAERAARRNSPPAGPVGG